MRLTAIKLSGFKSFVDATTFRAPTNLTGIVGPNGCGKSNIIDAVRWVMGEGSARVLRGELMSDVIFSGSATRKPVGTATVELLFDNSDGQVKGEFAGYNEISVKRQVGRDGISSYALNGTRCRRKDIKDLFLGTGLGARSYSIIEQGMISQVVDARPEEIREHLEEAAGISRYKERRRETERRIKHTRENLERLADLREEVSSHLSRLKRQANAAERYRKLKQQQRELESRLLALKWREQSRRAEMGLTGLKVQETALEEQRAEQRAAESKLEQLHQQQAEAGEQFNAVQGELYAVASDIARLEQSIAHSREMQQRQQKEFEEVSASLQDLEQHMVLDKTQVEHLTQALADSGPALSSAEGTEAGIEQELQAAESAVQAWQEAFEQHHKANAAMNQEAQGLRTQIEVLDQRMKSAAERLQALDAESAPVDSQALQQENDALQKRAVKAQQREQEQRKKLEAHREALTGHRQAAQQSSQKEQALVQQANTVRGRLEALRALQQAALESATAQQWLNDNGLAKASQLASSMQTEAGWENSVETVLGGWLQGLVVRKPEDLAGALESLQDADLSLVSERSGQVRARSGTLAEKVKAPDAIIALLNHVRVQPSLADAMAFMDSAGDDESAITRDGEWVGPGWVRVARQATGAAGSLAREAEIKQQSQALSALEDELKSVRAALEEQRAAIRTEEEALDAAQGELNTAHRLRSELESQSSGAQARAQDLASQAERVAQELQRLQAQQTADSPDLKAARKTLSGLLDRMAAEEETRKALEAQRAELMGARDQARLAAREARDSRHELALAAGARRASLDSLQQSLERMDSQVSQLQQRYLSLSEVIAEARNPEKEFKAEMDGLLQKRVKVDERLTAERARLQGMEEDYRVQDSRRQQAVQKTDEIRASLEQARLQQQEVELTARGLQARVEELGHAVDVLVEDLPETVAVEEWEADIERLGERITRLEPVNLAAIQEYDEEFKRKEYLDAQDEDLTNALTTLENAIAKIDRKTRTRFKDTFEEVNKGVQELFPQLFGGGHAYLELTGEDLLTTGVAIMARPPGKRVSSIHLLSGGEKALTAVAFVFAIFQLNPAPFCLLDEVDAPLDDANVGRFSKMVREMSNTVQFIVVTHNKITMEMAHQLSGVTMSEPGVSRLVQVDIDEAARLVAN